MIRKKKMAGNEDRLIIAESKQIIMDILKTAMKMYRLNPTEQAETAIREVKQEYDRLK